MVLMINVFSENRPGKLEQIIGALADANVNIKAVKISHSEDYGRKWFPFLVDDGFRAFKQAGITVSLKDVLAVGVESKSGRSVT
jgi:hypothetical protein